MFRHFMRSPLRGGLYHLSLLLITGLTFNWGFLELTGINIAGRVFTGIELPLKGIAIAACLASGIVLWNNWVD